MPVKFCLDSKFLEVKPPVFADLVPTELSTTTDTRKPCSVLKNITNNLVILRKWWNTRPPHLATRGRFPTLCAAPGQAYSLESERAPPNHTVNSFESFSVRENRLSSMDGIYDVFFPLGCHQISASGNFSHWRNILSFARLNWP